jgi:hypothetical protein
MTWDKYVPRIFRSRYVRVLEDEVSRLRNENRALINSVLSIAGLPPLRLEAEIARENHLAEIELKTRRSGAAAQATTMGEVGRDRTGSPAAHDTNSVEQGASRNASSPPMGQGIGLPANPHRRRSWQQINRILEIEETRQITNRDNSDAMKPRVSEL